jgi:CSLREA domain-containing protein
MNLSRNLLAVRAAARIFLAGSSLLVLAALALLSPSALATETLINFDDVAGETVINTHYAGVTFTNPIGGNIFARNGGGFAPSSPNVYCITNGGGYPYFDALYGAVDAHFATAVRAVKVDTRPVAPLEFLTPLTKRPYLQAFDSANNLLATVYYAGALPTNAGEVGPIETLTYTSTSANIAYARVSSQNPGSSPPTYAMFDNLRYGDGLYPLTLIVVGSGTVAANPTPGPYLSGTVVTITPTPTAGWSFSGWSGDASGSANPLLLTMDAAKSVTATFVPTPQTGPNFIVTTLDDHDDGIAGVLDCSLREAVNAANANPDASIITFATNVTGTMPLTLGELVITHDLTILGPGTKVLAISGNNISRAFNIAGGTVRISDLAIMHCFVTGTPGIAGAPGGYQGGSGGVAYGGGIFNSGVLTVSNCWLYANVAIGGTGGVGGQDIDGNNPAGPGGTGGTAAGGGIYTTVNSLALVNCTISGNSAIGGAGGDGSHAYDNYPSDIGGHGGQGGLGVGGGISASVPLTVNNCTFSGNFCSGGVGGSGGGAYGDGDGAPGGTGGGALGGGLANLNNLQMASSTLSLNTVTGGAGGTSSPGRDFTPPNGTPGAGQGGGAGTVATAMVQNSIIAGNTGLASPDCFGGFTSQGYNLVGITNGSIGFTGSGDKVGNIGTPLNPLLGPLADVGGPTPTMELLTGSPALDQGNSGGLTRDQRGRPRPFDILSIPNAPGGDGSDIGAFELNQPALRIIYPPGNAVLSWAATDPGFTPQSTTSLSPPIWTTVPISPLVVAGTNTVTVPTGAGSQFFRLAWAGVSPIPGVFNTGIGTNGSLLASGAVDPHWQMIQSADAGFPGPNAIVVNDTGFPIPPWLANGPASKWLAPQASQSVGNQSGAYKYRIKFSLTGLEPSTAVIAGHWTSDNQGPQVLLNGVSTGVTNNGDFTTLGNAFAISTGFIAGTNTLDLVVTNLGPGINPTGVRVELNGTVNLLPPP